MFIICYVFINKTSRLQFWVFSRNSSYWGSKITDWLTQLNWCDSVNEMRRAKLLHQTSFLPPVDPTALIPTNTPVLVGERRASASGSPCSRLQNSWASRGRSGAGIMTISTSFAHIQMSSRQAELSYTGPCSHLTFMWQPAEQPWKHGIAASWHF